MKRIYTLAIAVVAVIGLALFATPASAVHKGAGGLACGSCHTMHNSQGSTTVAGTAGYMGAPAGGTLKLLRGSAANHNFCLRCHAEDGSKAADGAPKVLTNNTDFATGTQLFSEIGAGGDFGTACGVGVADSWACSNENAAEAVAGNALGRAHSLGAPSTVVPPGGDAALGVEFRCTNCHDAHGTDVDTNASVNKFRNLLFTPTGSGIIGALDRDLNVSTAVGGEYTSGWKGSTSGVFTTVTVAGATLWPISDGIPSNSVDSNVYTSKTTGTGISAFCATCHDNWHETVVPGNYSAPNWKRHAVDADLDAAGIVDYANYGGVVDDEQLPAAHSDGVGATYTYVGSATAANNKVFCLSCHFAHGGPYYDNLRWQHATAVSAGDQTASILTSAVGCQQCHNK